MSAAQITNVLVYTGNLIALGFGLWLALPLERAASAKLLPEAVRGEGRARVLRVMNWLGLGFLVALPFLNLIGLVQTTATLVRSEAARASMARVAWGTAPNWVSAGLNTLAMLAVYGLFMYVAAPLLREKLTELGPSEVSAHHATFALLGGAGIVWNGVNLILFLALRPEVRPLQLTAPERGMVGFLGGWLLAIGVVITLGLFHSSQQADYEDVVGGGNG